MKLRTALIAASLLAGVSQQGSTMSFECTDAENMGERALKIVVNEQAWFTKLREDVASGARQKSTALNNEMIQHSDVMLANLDSVLISLHFLRKQNCSPAANANLDARIREYQSAYDDLKDERKQVEAARSAYPHN
jgi:hypothetical protein